MKFNTSVQSSFSFFGFFRFSVPKVEKKSKSPDISILSREFSDNTSWLRDKDADWPVGYDCRREVEKQSHNQIGHGTEYSSAWNTTAEHDALGHHDVKNKDEEKGRIDEQRGWNTMWINTVFKRRE